MAEANGRYKSTRFGGIPLGAVKGTAPFSLRKASAKIGTVPRKLALICLVVLSGCGNAPETPEFVPVVGDDGAYHVHPGDDVQEVLEAAARDTMHKTVRLHAGVYRPSHSGQALIWFNARHDGITVEAVGDVTLTAANRAIADPSASSFPAVVNHVVYFGDGISNRTVMRGFKITQANGFVTDAETPGPIERDHASPKLAKNMFFYTDGGAVKVFGRSYPTLVDLEIVDNATVLCAGGISVEHRGYGENSVLIKNCVFKNNRCPATGSAVDILSGSSAVIENCLFVGNIANTGMEEVARKWGLEHNPQHGSGALTVFPSSRVHVDRCTFTGNWNGADDQGDGSVYVDSIFWMNNAWDQSRPGGPYELDILDADNVKGCYLKGETDDLRGTLDRDHNVLDAPDPHFDELYRPTAKEYKGVGYRPAAIRKTGPR